MFLGDYAKKVLVKKHTDTRTGETYFTAKVLFGYDEGSSENIQRFFKDVMELEGDDYIKLNLPENRFWKVMMDKKPMKEESDVLVIDACAY
jgi:hypothetical protein